MIFWRIRATRRVRKIAGGSTSSEIRVSCQVSATIATIVATTVVRLAAMLVAVEVTTDCMPPMSLVIRDCTSPVRVRVKKPTDCRCRWLKTSTRSRCMTRWPTVVEIHVCTTPSTDVIAATTTMPPTSHDSSRRSSCGRATSMISRSRNGDAMPSTDATTMIATTSASCLR